MEKNQDREFIIGRILKVRQGNTAGVLSPGRWGTAWLSARFLLPALTLCAALTASAQTGQPTALNYQITSQARDSALWQATESWTNAAGVVMTRTNSFTQLETGLNFWDPNALAWTPSNPELAVAGQLVTASRTAHAVAFGDSLYSTPLADITLPDGQHFKEQLLGVSYYNTETGESVFIAQVTNASAQLVLNTAGVADTVLYTNAFSGLKGAVEYANRRDGVERNIILQTQLPSPSLYSDAMTPSNVIVEIVSQVLDSPSPNISAVQVVRASGVAPAQNSAAPGQDGEDDRVDFGAMTMRVGRGFPVAASGQGDGSSAGSLRVRKLWLPLPSATVLIERIDFLDLQKALRSLPAAGMASIQGAQPDSVRHLPQLAAKGKPVPVRTVRRETAPSGFVIDQKLVSTATNLLVAGGQTFLVTGPVNLSGTTVIEGGSVTKLANTNNAGLTILGDINCQTRPYFPAEFTGMTDNNSGQTVPWNSGNVTNYYGAVALTTEASNGRLEYLRFNQISTAIKDYGTGTRLMNAQFVNCYYGYNLQNTYVELNNVLFAGLAGAAMLGYAPNFTGYHLTVDNCGSFDGFGTSAGNFYITNSLVVDSPLNVNNNHYTIYTVSMGTEPWNFAPTGAGGHYLPSFSPYRGLGTTNVPPRVSSNLQSLTSQAPVVWTNTAFTGGSVVFSPQVPRDTGVPGYDLGYHYSPLDDLILGTIYCTNTVCVLTNGVAVGGSGGSAGMVFSINDGSQFESVGLATNLNVLTFFNCVQEQNTNWVSGGYAEMINTANAGSSLPGLSASFTWFTAQAGNSDGYELALIWSGYTVTTGCLFQNCYMGGLFTEILLTSPQTYDYTFRNNVMEASTEEFLNNVILQFNNNTLVNGSLILDLTPPDTSYFSDNFFDSCAIYNYDSGTTITNGTEAYWNSTQITPTNSTDIILTSPLAFVNGPLGPWYQPTNSPLLGHGSRLASAAGLYQFTTQFSQTKNGSNTVDVGFHYVACAPVTNSPPYTTTVWVDDSLPAGATATGWTWGSSSPVPYSGTSNWSVTAGSGLNQSYFTGATTTMYVGKDATLFCYVYLPPGSVPTTIELQWNDVNGYWDHRAYWGAHDISYGVDGTVGRRYMGPMPATTGSWIELAVPASAVALEDCIVSGMAYTVYQGTAYWDYTGVQNPIWAAPVADCTGGSGIPDYFADSNGNGAYDTGDFSNWQLADTVYLGVTDLQEFLLGNTPSTMLPPSAPQVRLGYWRFNQSNWQGQEGQLPILATNVVFAVSTNFDGNALLTSSTPMSGYTNSTLIYNTVEANENENIDLVEGSIRFYIRPNWMPVGHGGSGPGHWVRLLEVGHYTPGASYGLFAISIDPTGNYLSLQTQDNAGNQQTNITFAIGSFFSTNVYWYPVQVFWSNYYPETGIFFGQNQSPNGPAIGGYPSAAVRAQGFSIGSSMDGTMPLEGLIDEVETYNHVQTGGEFDEWLGWQNFWPSIGFDSPSGSGNLTFEFSRGTFQASPLSVAIQTNTLAQTNWGVLSAGFTAMETSVSLQIGTEYQFMLGISNSGSPVPLPPIDTLVGGIALPQVEYRGKVILLVDQTLSGALSNSLVQLQTDLEGDGWTVVQTNVGRHDDLTWANNTNNIQSTKTFITNTFKADTTNTKAVFIVGHVAIPYAGYGAPDGHTLYTSPYVDHYGAWPADTYYGDVDGHWTDVGTNSIFATPYYTNTMPLNYTNTSYAANDNWVGDGRWDQDYIPTNAAGIAALELAVGRIDFANLPEMTNAVWSNSTQLETNLLMQYFAKVHAYKTKATVLANQGIYSSIFEEAEQDGAMLACGCFNSCVLFGLNPALRAPGAETFAQTNSASFLLAVEGGFGHPDGIDNSLASAYYYVTNFVSPIPEPRIGFYILDGSFFGDFNMTNDFLRGCLGTPHYGFASVWAGGADPHAFTWELQDCALGAPLGTAMLRTLNDPNQPSVGNSGQREISIMGDPTLRFQITAPPTQLNAWNLGGSSELLAWTPAAETNAAYFVYRSSSVHGPFTNRLNSVAISQNSLTDSAAVSGSSTYMVRTAVLVTTGSGSFTNLSQGAIITVSR